ncbi:MAG: 4'-phosphopantetheinyl transferase family protein [Aureispira sp.]
MKRFTSIMIHVYLYNNALRKKDLIKKLPTLPFVIQQRINRHKRLKNQLSSLAGYLLLQQALKEQEHTIKQLQFLSIGKPYIPDLPLSFSISHNANLVGLCLLLKEGKIGLDIQEFRCFAPIESAFSFFSSIEQQAILTSQNADETLIHYWSKKEALIKAGNGRMFDEAALTDTTNPTCYWKGETFYWQTVSTSFPGVIWVASNQVDEKILIKKVLFL